MIPVTPKQLKDPSRILGALNGQRHVTDTNRAEARSYGFFVHPGGAEVTTLELDSRLNSGDTTFLDGATLTAETEYIIPGIIAITLASGGVSLFLEDSE